MILHGVEIFVALDPIDPRRIFDRLAGIVEERMGKPFGTRGTEDSHRKKRLVRLNPEEYLRDVLRVLPHWPEDRYLELAPKLWKETRARLDLDDLAKEIGLLTVPEPWTRRE